MNLLDISDTMAQCHVVHIVGNSVPMCCCLLYLSWMQCKRKRKRNNNTTCWFVCTHLYNISMDGVFVNM